MFEHIEVKDDQTVHTLSRDGNSCKVINILKPFLKNPANPEKEFLDEVEIVYSLTNPGRFPESIDGRKYFARFFQPSSSKRKQIIFVIDASKSMSNYNRLESTKEAMYSILASLTANDYFHIVTYSMKESVWPKPSRGKNNFYKGTDANKKAAFSRLKSLSAAAGGGDLISLNGALQETIH